MCATHMTGNMQEKFVIMTILEGIKKITKLYLRQNVQN